MLSDRARFIFKSIQRKGLLDFSRAALAHGSAKALIGVRTRSRDELITRTQSNGRYWEFGIKERHEFETEAANSRCRFSDPVGVCTSHPRFVCELQNCRIFGGEPVFFDSDGRLLLEVAKDYEQFLRVRLATIFEDDGVASSIIQMISNEPVSPLQTVFPLIRHSHQRSYYHWILEDLPTLRSLERYEAETGIDATILVEQDPPSWIIESISATGFSNIREWHSGDTRCDRLVVPSHNVHSPSEFHPSMRDYLWLRNRILSSSVSGPSEGKQHRIFISRQDANERRVANMAEIEPLLDRFGFEIVHLAQMSFEAQVSLFSNAECVLGPHGAGFTNILFSEDPLVVEFLPQDDRYAFFRNLSQMLEHEYRCLPCQRDGNDVLVPPEEIESTLLGMIEPIETQ